MLRSFVFFVLAATFLAASPHLVRGATTSVQIVDNQFVPQSITNTAGDTVTWSWEGIASHSSTSSAVAPLWDSGIHGNGFVFSRTFPTPGSFPYRCVVHLGQTGTILVKAATASNAPPQVSILSPANGSIFAAPLTTAIAVRSSDSDGRVTNLDFFADSVWIGALANPAATVQKTVTNLLAGSHSLRVVATDDRGATNTSALVNLSIIAPGPILLSAPTQVSANSFRVTFSTTAGLSYVVSRSSDLLNWIPLSTNVATGATTIFTDEQASDADRFYSVSLLPNL